MKSSFDTCPRLSDDGAPAQRVPHAVRRLYLCSHAGPHRCQGRSFEDASLAQESMQFADTGCNSLNFLGVKLAEPQSKWGGLKLTASTSPFSL